MTRTLFSILFVVGHVLGLSPAVRSEEAEKSALRQSVGQKIVVGFFGQKNSDPDFRRVLKNLEQGIVGGVLFLGRNISTRTDLEIMVRDVRNCKCAKTPLIAIDEEGGVIERLGETKGFENTPSAAEIGGGSEGEARAAYQRLANKLSELGFNTNLAPVVEIQRIQ